MCGATMYIIQPMKRTDKLDEVPESHMKNMSLQQLASWVIRTLDHMGLNTATTRLDAMNRVLQRGYIAPEDPDFPIPLEAMLDIPMMAFILDELGGIDRTQLVAKLRLTLMDDPLLRKGQTNTLGRNTQSELYVAAVCEHGGMGVRLEEPDVTVNMKGQRYGLAVKRLKSDSQIEKRFRSAAHQIEKSGLPGFIVLNIRPIFYSWILHLLLS